MEHHHFSWENYGKFTISMVIFHSYVDITRGYAAVCLVKCICFPDFAQIPWAFGSFGRYDQKGLRLATHAESLRLCRLQASGNFNLAILDGEHHPIFGIEENIIYELEDHL